MKITAITRWDYDACCDIMTAFAQQCGVSDLNKPTYDREYAKNVLLRCERTGASFIARTDDNQAMGIILSMAVPELWQPNIIRLRELAWYVLPQYRGTTAGARLFAAYVNAAENMQKQGRITSFTMTKLANSQDFNYEKRGFKLVESTYIKEIM